MEASFGNLLRRARMRKKLTQKDMADALCTNTSTISKLENEEQQLKASDLVLWIQKTNAQDLFTLFGLEIQIITDTVMSTPGLVGFLSPLFRLFV